MMEAAMYGLKDWALDLIQNGVDIIASSVVRNNYVDVNFSVCIIISIKPVDCDHIFFVTCTCRWLRRLH